MCFSPQFVRKQLRDEAEKGEEKTAHQVWQETKGDTETWICPVDLSPSVMH